MENYRILIENIKTLERHDKLFSTYHEVINAKEQYSPPQIIT